MDSDKNGAKPKRDWLAIRHQYETGTMGQRALAKMLGLPESTLMRRAMREKWIQRSKLVRRAAGEIDARLKASVKSQVDRELAPWIEEQKVKFTKRGFKLASRGVARAERFFKRVPDADAKSEANIAKAADTYHRMGRLALGMSDGSAPASTFPVAILANHAAVQFVQPNESSQSQS